MSSHFRPDHLTDYDLLQAFTLLGQHLFGDEWSANYDELRVDQEPPNPDEVRAKLDRAKEELAEIDRRIADEKIIQSRSVKETAIAESKARADALYNEKTVIWGAQHRLPTYDDSLIARRKAWERRQHVEQILIGALASGNLQYWFSSMSTDSEKEIWQRTRGNRYVLPLSLARVDRHDRERRWQFVRIYRQSFDDWVKTQKPANSERLKNLPALQRAELWFKEFVAENGGRKVTRDDCLDNMTKLFGPELSRNAAQTQIWDRFAPRSWRQPGKPRKQNR